MSDFTPSAAQAAAIAAIKDWFETFVAQYLVADNVILPLVYRDFDDAGLTKNGVAISMMCEFMVDWMTDNARWVDALVKFAAGASASRPPRRCGTPAACASAP